MKKVIYVLLFSLLLTSVSTASRLDELKEKEADQTKKAQELADKKSKQQALKNEIDNEYNAISAQIDENNSALQALFNAINELEIEIQDLNLEVEDLELQVSEQEINIDKVKIELEDIREKKDKLKELGAIRIKSMYEYGEVTMFEILIQSESISDFFNRVEYTNKLVESDRKLFENLQKLEDETVAVESALEIAQDTLQFIVDEKNAKLDDLDLKVASKGQEVENAQKLLAEQKAIQEELASQQEEAQEQLDLIASEKAQIEKELDEIIRLKQIEINNASGVKFTGGRFVWPLPGYSRISSPYGYRTIWGRSQFHNGTDLPAPRGTRIEAAGAGEVIISKYSVSFGNYVAIAHGDGYVTLYGHMSKRSVSAGQIVQAGQKIGEVGTTGYSTGNHLHFGVKKNGSYVNPMSFFN